jgi:hypothetical protein
MVAQIESWSPVAPPKLFTATLVFFQRPFELLDFLFLASNFGLVVREFKAILGLVAREIISRL